MPERLRKRWKRPAAWRAAAARSRSRRSTAASSCRARAPFGARWPPSAGPGFLVAVGYMDPGNWATDLAGGAQFGYTLLSVVLISNFMAILLQHLCVKLGIATGRDLAQACRDHYATPTIWFLWVICELAIAACDLAEVVGSAIGLQLLFGIPIVWGCVITCLDVLARSFPAEQGLSLYRSGGRHAHCDHRRMLLLRALFCPAQPDGRDAGLCPEHRNSKKSGYALRQHRHPGRDRHAA